MKNLKLFFFILLASHLSWSCSKILSATFESDPVNGLPAKDLAGAPSGDVIEYHDEIEQRLKVQNSSISGSKALHFTYDPIDNPIPLAGQWLSFKGIGTDLTQTLWFSYTGQNNAATVAIDVSDGHGHLIARMRIRPTGEIGLAQNLADDYSDVIGNVGSNVHTVIFTVFTSDLKYNVTVTKGSGPAITTENKPMITDNLLSFSNPAHPTLSFLHAGEEPNGSTYAIGSVTISRKEP